VWACPHTDGQRQLHGALWYHVLDLVLVLDAKARRTRNHHAHNLHSKEVRRTEEGECHSERPTQGTPPSPPPSFHPISPHKQTLHAQSWQARGKAGAVHTRAHTHPFALYVLARTHSRSTTESSRTRNTKLAKPMMVPDTVLHKGLRPAHPRRHARTRVKHTHHAGMHTHRLHCQPSTRESVGDAQALPHPSPRSLAQPLPASSPTRETHMRTSRSTQGGGRRGRGRHPPGAIFFTNSGVFSGSWKEMVLAAGAA
jgi:hypothetical protein